MAVRLSGCRYRGLGCAFVLFLMGCNFLVLILADNDQAIVNRCGNVFLFLLLFSLVAYAIGSLMDRRSRRRHDEEYVIEYDEDPASNDLDDSEEWTSDDDLDGDEDEDEQDFEDVTEEEAPESAPRPRTPRNIVSSCPGCGAPSRGNDLRCSKCGSPFPDTD